MNLAERNLDFDKIIDRTNTDSLKYDFAVERGMPKGILPLWVADMDFQTSSYILDAISERVNHGIFGYSDTKDEYFETVSSWMDRRHGWKVEKDWMITTPGVVFALAMAVRAFTKEGEAVLIQQPVYYPFSRVVNDNKRKLVVSDIKLMDDNRYHMDLEDVERKIVEDNVKMLMLCSPHNPVSRVWSKEELCALGDICLKHNVIIMSDEIHADFVYEDNKHYVLSDLKLEYSQITITATAPSKTFNIAGLQVSNVFIPNKDMRRKFEEEIAAAGYSQINSLGIVACRAAYEHGEEWYQAMLKYVKTNIDYVDEYLKNNIPSLKMIKPEGTYLVWIDFKELGLNDEELDSLVVNKAGLWLDGGTMFGESGSGFQRINVACPRKTLTKALDKLRDAVISMEK